MFVLLNVKMEKTKDMIVSKNNIAIIKLRI